jgi:hypothetical protein
MTLSESLYRAAQIPAMQHKLFLSRAEALDAPSAILELCQDQTGIVFNKQFNPELITYNSDYHSDQGYSLEFRRHLLKVYKTCYKFLPHKDALVVDIGCGKGGFVELLREQGVNAIGYDISYQGNNPYIQKAFFNTSSHHQGDLLTLRHVLEHIPCPWQFLADIAAANDYKGILYVEVPDLDWILEHNAYFDLFHEHVNYFRADDFCRVFENGVIWKARSFNEQYLSVMIKLESLRKNLCQPSEPSATDPGLLHAFSRLSVCESNVYSALLNNSNIVIWGAGAKGVMFAAKAPKAIINNIAYAIDLNPSKQFHFMPLSGVEILNPSAGIDNLDPTSIVVVMNPNYEQEIRQSLHADQPLLVLR